MAAGDDPIIEEVASMMYAAALAFTNTIGKKGWSWDHCPEEAKEFWRRMARRAEQAFLGKVPKL